MDGDGDGGGAAAPVSSGAGFSTSAPLTAQSNAPQTDRASGDPPSNINNRRRSLLVPFTHLPRVSGELSRAELIERKIRSHKIRNEARQSYMDLFRVKSSVIPRVFWPAFIHTLWGTLWTVLFMVGKIDFFVIPPQLITILGVVISLLLVFRTNTAYDRFWEGRRTWATLTTQIRNLARFTWINVQTQDEFQMMEKRGCINLLLAFAVATKHYLRNELGHKYADLHHLLIHLPDFAPGQKYPDIKNLPLEVSFHLSSYIAKCRQLELIDVSTQTSMTNGLSTLVDCLTSLERIRNTPIPLAYSIHLQQTLTLYILSLPFQLVKSVSWGTIPIMFIAAFTLLGIECIGGEIENPFGYDENDLRVEEFCHTAREELVRIMSRPIKLDPQLWGAPFTEGTYSDFKSMMRSAGAPRAGTHDTLYEEVTIDMPAGAVTRKPTQR